MSITNKQTSIILPTVANTAPVIARRGTDDTFVELSFRRLGDVQVELVATRVEYNAYSGAYQRNELGREICDVVDAENVACDLDYLAIENLDETNERGYADPCGFDEAVAQELDAVFAVAAE